MEDGRGTDTLGVDGALRVQDGQVLTQTALARHTTGYLALLTALLTAVAPANPAGDLYLIADTLSSHSRRPIQDGLAAHPRVHPVPLPVGASWLTLIAGWWRSFRRKAFAGQDFANHHDLAVATRLATHQLNARARPWIWGAHPKNTAGSVFGSCTAFDERCTSAPVALRGIVGLYYLKDGDMACEAS